MSMQARHCRYCGNALSGIQLNCDTCDRVHTESLRLMRLSPVQQARETALTLEASVTHKVFATCRHELLIAAYDAPTDLDRLLRCACAYHMAAHKAERAQRAYDSCVQASRQAAMRAESTRAR